MTKAHYEFHTRGKKIKQNTTKLMTRPKFMKRSKNFHIMSRIMEENNALHFRLFHLSHRAVLSSPLAADALPVVDVVVAPAC